MNKLIHTILISIVTVVAFGQQQYYFNKRIDHHSNYDRSRNVIESDSGYIIGGITEDSTYMFNYHLTLTKIDWQGNQQWIKEYGYDSINYFFGEPGSLIHYSDSIYYASCYKRIYTGDWVHDQGMLVCFDSEFDTLWTRLYGEKTEPYDTAFLMFQLNKTLDGGLIMTGGRKPAGLQTRIWLLKTDSSGNKQWERFFGEGEEYFSGYSVIQTTDGGYAIGGFKFTIGDSNSGDPLIIKTDSLGNEEWRINPGSQYADSKAMLTLSNDGSIVVGSNYATEPHGDNRNAKNQILIIRNDGSIFLDRKYGDSKYDNFLTQIRIKNNGDIIATGTYVSFDPKSTGWTLCTDSNGSQKWYREYVNLYGDGSHNYLLDIIPTSLDKGFLACGWVGPNPPDTGTEEIWVRKLDSLGYDTTPVGIIEKHDKYPGMVIYPSPVSKEFTVEIGAFTTNPLLLVFYNQYGLKVEELKILNDQKQITIDASNWSGGVYVVVIREQGNVIGKSKFVVK